MSKKDKTLKGIKIPSRRKFFKAAAATGAVAAATLAMPSIAKAATTLKVQAAWGGGIFLENAQAYVKRVNEMSGGALKIDLLAVNSVVKTSQMQDAVHRGVLDGAHYVPAYWYSKAASASLFGTGPCWGWSAQELLGWIHYGGGIKLFNESQFDVCKIFYNKFKNVITQIPQEQQIIPIENQKKKEEKTSDNFYEFEPEENEILNDLLPSNISTQIFKAFLENAASEQGSRMTAMDSATRNAGDLVDKLTITYNRSRQAAITKELIEIISGAESL